jgi:uncharacterized alkaline shock family protein YloU
MDEVNVNAGNDIDRNNIGTIRITEDVVSVIAGLAAVEIPGVASMSGGFAGGIAEALGMKNLSKGVKVDIGEKEVSIDLYIIVEYGVRIPEVAWNIQEKVKKTVENMTGLIVTEVNIHVQGINLARENKKEIAETSSETKQ